MKSEQEEWRPVVGYEGYYEVSNLGRIRSLDRVCSLNSKIMPKRTYRGKILVQRVTKDGYCTLLLCKDGYHRGVRVHRIVAQAFIPNPNNLPHINHKNEIKNDNRVENLEWCDSKYNENYGTKPLRVSISKSIPCIAISPRGETMWFAGINIAGRITGFNHRNIHRAIVGGRKTCGGFMWKYADKEET